MMRVSARGVIPTLGGSGACVGILAGNSDHQGSHNPRIPSLYMSQQVLEDAPVIAPVQEVTVEEETVVITDDSERESGEETAGVGTSEEDSVNATAQESRVIPNPPEQKIKSVKKEIKELVTEDDKSDLQDRYVSYDSIYTSSGSLYVKDTDSIQIFNWCISASDQDKESEQYIFWCNKRQTISDTNTVKSDFSDDDYDALSTALEDSRFSSEKEALERLKGTENKSTGITKWCTNITEIPFLGEEAIVAVIKAHCI